MDALFPGLRLSPSSLGDDVPDEEVGNHLNTMDPEPALISTKPPEHAVDARRIAAKLWRNRGKVTVLCGPEFQGLCSFPLHSPAVPLDTHPYTDGERRLQCLPPSWKEGHVFSRSRVEFPEGKKFWGVLNARSFRVSRSRKRLEDAGIYRTWSEGLRILRDRAIARRCYTTNVYGEERRLVERGDEGEEDEEDFFGEFYGTLRPGPQGFDWSGFLFEGESGNLRTVENFRTDLSRSKVLLVLGMLGLDDLQLPLRKLVAEFPGTVIANSAPGTAFVFPHVRLRKDGTVPPRFSIDMSGDQFLFSLGCFFSREVSNQCLDILCDPDRGFLSTEPILSRV